MVKKVLYFSYVLVLINQIKKPLNKSERVATISNYYSILCAIKIQEVVHLLHPHYCQIKFMCSPFELVAQFIEDHPSNGSFFYTSVF